MKKTFEEVYSEARAIQWAALGAARVCNAGGSRVTRRRTAVGMSFDILREYADGDDVRAIDWKSSARVNTLMVRSYHEQRREEILILVENRPTLYTGSLAMRKSEYAAYLGATMAVAAEHAGLLTRGVWAGEASGKRGIRSRTSVRYAAARELLAGSEMSPWTNEAFEDRAGLVRILPPAGWAIIITDGLSPASSDFVHDIALRMPCAVVRLIDPLEENFPEVGVAATACGMEYRLDLCYRDARAAMRAALTEQRAEYKAALSARRIPLFDYHLGIGVRVFIEACCRRRWR